MNLANGSLAEARHYNAGLQLASITDSWNTSEQWFLQNTYSATQNNGNVTGQSERRFGTLPKAVLTANEPEQVMQQTKIHHPLALRDRAILETLYSTGMRRLELVNLTLWDLDLERASVAIRQGKGKKDSIIPLGDRTALWIRKYLDQSRPHLASEPDDRIVFISNAGEPLSLDYLTEMVAAMSTPPTSASAAPATYSATPWRR